MENNYKLTWINAIVLKHQHLCLSKEEFLMVGYEHALSAFKQHIKDQEIQQDPFYPRMFS